MTDKPAKNVAASVRQRLMNRRQASGEDYNALLTQYVIERFLYRLCQSDLADEFVLKSAMLFRVWSGALHRPTKDLDLLGRGDPTPDAVATRYARCWRPPVPDDGLSFDPQTVVAAEIREAQEYGGIRVKLIAVLDNARIPMQIDVGFGDAITPAATVHSYPTLLDQDAPRLRMYPPETVVAEKLEASVVRGMINSRMKDYYDLLVIFRVYDLDDRILARAIAATFKRRETELPADVPAGLSEDFGRDADAQRLWHAFLRRLRIEDAPVELSETVAAIRQRLWLVIQQARHLESR